ARAQRHGPRLRAQGRQPVHDLPAPQGGLRGPGPAARAERPGPQGERRRRRGWRMSGPLDSYLGLGPQKPRPFPETSRYAAVEVVTEPTPDGRPTAYLGRRFVPGPERYGTVREHVVKQGERLDNVTAAYLTDPEQFWRVCDANGALHPHEMEEEGRRLKIG